MKAKRLKMTEEDYDQICKTLVYYEDGAIDLEDLASDMYDILCEIVREYEESEED